MTPEDVRTALERLREEVRTEAIASKSPHEALEELSAWYAKLDPDARRIAESVLSEWLSSDDEGERWDAQALILAHGVRSALPALRELAERLEDAPGPGAPWEWAKVNRIIAQLAAVEDRP